MKLWERFLRIIYRTATKPFLYKYKSKSLESILGKSLYLLDESIQTEIRNRVLASFNSDGGFADRGGKSDLYYSIFGCFVSEALSIDEIKPQLKEFVKAKVKDPSLSGVNLYCGSILYTKTNGFDSTTEKLRKKIEAELEVETENKSSYSYFIGLITLYYLKDYRLILKLKKRIKRTSKEKDSTCSLTAAYAIVNYFFNRSKNFSSYTFLRRQESKSLNKMDSRLSENVRNSIGNLFSFYRGKGGFAAIQKAPVPDLLSTAVALYSLHFIDTDLKDIKPDCLTFVDDLYLNGGFRATEMDFDIDIEYTFYGLLALGSLTD